MNAVQRILCDISDVDLKQAVSEMKKMEDSGVLPDGVVRAIMARVHGEAGLSEHTARKVVWQEVYRIAAYRWAEI